MQVLWELPFRYAGAGARELHVLVSYNEAGDQAELLTMRAANPKPRFVQPVAWTQTPLQRFEERAKHACHNNSIWRVVVILTYIPRGS
jgi:hypothetical protein